MGEVPLHQILRESPRIGNFHFHCRLVQTSPEAPGQAGAGPAGRRMVFPLQDMQSDLAGLRYKSPNLKILLGESAPSATFSKRGCITLVGGGSRERFREWLFQACVMIITALGRLCPSREFTVAEFRINQKVATVAAKGRFFLARLHDELRANNFHAEIGKGIGYLYVKRVFGENDDRVTFCICPSGMINIISFRHDYQAAKGLRLLSPFLKRNLVSSPPSNST